MLDDPSLSTQTQWRLATDNNSYFRTLAVEVIQNAGLANIKKA
jgi:hypothetical protein